MRRHDTFGILAIIIAATLLSAVPATAQSLYGVTDPINLFSGNADVGIEVESPVYADHFNFIVSGAMAEEYKRGTLGVRFGQWRWGTYTEFAWTRSRLDAMDMMASSTSDTWGVAVGRRWHRFRGAAGVRVPFGDDDGYDRATTTYAEVGVRLF